MFMGMNYEMQNTLSVLDFYPMKSCKNIFFDHYIIEFTTLILRNTMQYQDFAYEPQDYGTFIEFISKMNIHV